MIFLALVLAASIDTVPPKIIHKFKTADECALSAMKLNAKPEMNTEEANAAGATYVCLSLIDPSV